MGACLPRKRGIIYVTKQTDSDSLVERDRPALSPLALLEFEDLFLAWLSGNRDFLEEGGVGDLAALALEAHCWSLGHGQPAQGLAPMAHPASGGAAERLRL